VSILAAKMWRRVRVCPTKIVSSIEMRAKTEGRGYKGNLEPFKENVVNSPPEGAIVKRPVGRKSF